VRGFNFHKIILRLKAVYSDASVAIPSTNIESMGIRRRASQSTIWQSVQRLLTARNPSHEQTKDGTWKPPGHIDEFAGFIPGIDDL